MGKASSAFWRHLGKLFSSVFKKNGQFIKIDLEVDYEKRILEDIIENSTGGGVSFLFLFALLACGEDTGLGASVDTEAPKLAITYPPSSAVIREDFVFAGTCSDDKGVSSVVATIKNVDTGLTFEEKATVTGNNWSVALNKKKGEGLNDWGLIEYEYPDGKYEISVVAYDGVGHTSGTNTRTVEIDNTPPIFFITSPQIDDLSDMTNYGTRFKIVGTIADEHKVKSMKVVVYDKDGKVVADSETNPITVNNVTTAGGTSETVASYLNMETTGNKLNDNYIAIYFADNPDRTGTVEYKCTVTLTDEAQVYRGQDADSAERSAIETETAGAGNSSSNLYAYYNIRDLVGADVFDANTMMQIINGTYNGEDADFLKGVLKKSGNCQTEARFTLNPKANPTYNAIGFAISSSEKDESKSWAESTRGAIMSLVAQQGLNQSLIEKNPTRTYLLGPVKISYPYIAADGIERNREVLVDFINDKKSDLLKLYGSMEDLSDAFRGNYDSDTKTIKDEDKLFAEFKNKNAELLKSLTGRELSDSNFYFDRLDSTESGVTGTGETYTYSYTIPEKLPIAGESYIVLATGWDKDELPFSNGTNFYGFKFTVSSNAPTFSDVKFSTDENVQVNASEFINNGRLSISGKANSTSNGIQRVEYKFTVSNEAGTDNTTVTGFENAIDGAKEFDGGSSVDFTFNLLEKLSDAQKTQLTAKGNRYLYAVILTAYDVTGKSFSAQYVIHVDTKDPVIDFTNAKTVYTDDSKTNWIGTAGLSSLKGSIDEENPKEVSYAIIKNSQKGESHSLGSVYSFDLKAVDFKEITFEQSNKIQVEIAAQDKAGNSSTGLSDVYTVDATSPKYVHGDMDGENAPKAIRINKQPYVTDESKGKTWLNDTALTFEGWYEEEDSGINAVHYVVNPTANISDGKSVKEAEGAGAMGATRSPDTDYSKYSKFSSIVSGFNSSGKSIIYLAAEDNVGNISSLMSFEIYIDQIGPTFEDVAEEKRNIPANGTKDVKFEITVRDQEDASGIDVDKITVIAIENGNSYKLSDLGQEYFSKNYDEATGKLICTITAKYLNLTEHEGATSSVNTLRRKFNGNVTLQITVPDKAGNSSQNQQFILQVDSDAPTVKVTVPAAVASDLTDYKKINWITGKTTIQGTVTDVGVSGVDEVGLKFLIPTIAQQKAIAEAKTSDDRISSLSSADWKCFAGDDKVPYAETDGVTWSITYDSSFLEKETLPSDDTRHSFVYYGAAGGDNPDYATIFPNTPDITRYRTVPIYFLVTDKAGNQDVVTGNKIYVDIEGGKPRVSISYPKDKTDSSGAVTSWAKLSEEVALQGTAQDNEAVTKVELTELWYATADAGTIFTKYKSVTAPDTKTDETDWTRVKSDDAELINVADVTLTKSESVNLTIEQAVTGTSVVEPFDIEFDLTKLAETLQNDKKKITAIKAVVSVQDENGYNYSAVRYAFIDTETPTLSDEKILMLSKPLADGVTKITSLSNGTLEAGGESYTVLVERKYEPDMWLSGAGGAHWYYVGTVKDDSTIESIELSKQSGIAFEKSITVKTEELKNEDGGYVSYTFAIPIPADKDGNMYSKLTRNDGAHKDVNSYISLNIDNTAPQMRTVKYGTTKEGFAEKITDGRLKLVADGDLGDKYVIENSNGSFSFGDQVQESGSGLAFIAFWIERNKAQTVYNPVIKGHADNTYMAGVTNKSTAKYETSRTSGKVYLNSDKFPALYVEGLKVSGKTIDNATYTTVTYNSISSNDFINRAGGMVKINGSYYKVQEVSGDTITLNSDLGLTGSVDVEFIYASFIDHMGTETYSLSSDGKTYEVANDDDSDNGNGDGIAESLKAKSGVYTWTAEFDSNNMSDGPARINVVTMDNAGNMSRAYVDTSIQNNRPRIAKVFLATDLDGNERFDFYSESDRFGGELLKTGDSKYDPKNPYKYDLDKLEVENGTELGEFMFFSTLDEDGNSSALAEVKDRGVNNNFIVMDKFLILPEIVGGNTDKGELKYTYSVVDSANDVAVKKSTTELGTFVTGDTLNDLLAKKSNSPVDIDVLPKEGIYFGRNLKDKEEPSLGETESLETYESWTQINGVESKKSKFFGITIWDATGVDDSNIQQGENTLWALLSVPVVVNVKDDIPPTPTITPFYWESKEESSTVYDDDGLPLGHIDYLDGDGKVMAKPGVAGQIYLEGIAKDDSRVDAIYITAPSEKETLAAKRGEGGWQIMKSEFPNKWMNFEILGEDEPSQKGNTVYWRLTIDTSDYGVLQDQVFTVSASDKNNKSKPCTTQTIVETNTDYYRVDFVPYIKSITLSDGTSLRSRLGRYSVRAGEEIIIEGMNFGTSGTATVHFYKSGSSTEDSSLTLRGIEITNNTVTIKAPDYSRFVSVEVGGVETQNNTNSNERGYNIEEGYVAKDSDLGLKKSSQNGTNFWTDDRYISVWNVETNFPGSINPHSGVIKKVRKEDTWKNGGTIGINKSGSDMSNSEDYAINMNDSFFGFISSDDMRVYQYSQKSDGTINQRYTMQNNNLATFTAPVDAVDCVIVGGLPYYVVQTNYVGNTAAERWGLGLILSREGFNYTKDAFESSKTLSETQYPFTIERQGNEQSAVARDSSTGYDAVLYQFKNFRMAGWHNSDPKTAEKCQYSDSGGNNLRDEVDYIYVSYYDSFAKCLKYAAYRSGRGTYNNDISPVAHPGEWGGGNTGDREVVPEVSGYGNMTNGATVVAGYDYAQKGTPSSFEEKAGEWSDIVLDTNTKDDRPIPVIVYYNETKKSLEIARGKSTFPKSEGKESNGGKLTGEDAWTKTKAVRPKGVTSDFGRYVSAAIDTSGNLHIAAQDVKNARLYYLYLTLSGDTYTVEKSVAVDASSGAGVWTDIELTKPDGDSIEACKPVISYINNNYIKTTDGMKVAYLDRVEEDGTPVFEAMTDPAKWQVGDQRTSVLPDVKETKNNPTKAIVGVGFNSDMLALDFLRGEGE